MHSLFFGPDDDALYGVCHPADAGTARSIGIVICAPILHEADDAHRALRGLSDQLAQAGIDVLRFDYHGTGDSDGEPQEADVERWTRDISLAIDELKASREPAAIGLVGLRFGASLAALAAARGPHELSRLVLWEPVVRGADYAASLRELQTAWLAHEMAERPGAARLATPHEVVGFPVEPGFSAQLETVDLTTGPAPRARATLLVDEGHAGPELDALDAHLAGKGLSLERARLDGGAIWRREFDGEQAQVPRAILRRIVEWLSAAAPA